MHQIHDSLLPLAITIADLTPDPDNARRHTDRNLDSIAASLRAYGQRKPIVVQRQGMVVRAGNGTLDAARRLGWDQIAAVVIDETDITATAYALADNRTAELAVWDEPQLAKLLGQVSEGWDEYDPMAVGFEEAEVIRLLAKFGHLADSTLPDIDPFGQPEEVGSTADGGKTGKSASGSNADANDKLQTVHLYFDPAVHAQFLNAVRTLAGRYGTNNVTDTVMRALNEATATTATR